MYVVYILRSDNCSYVGMTNNFFRRIRQHNKEIKGGAKYTSKRDNWYPICIIDGFNNKKEACQCEWSIKHCKKTTISNGPLKRIVNLNTLLYKNKWTLNSPNISNQLLTIYIDDEYKDKMKRNVEHLEIIKAYKKVDGTTSIWTSESFTAIDAAITTGKAIYS